MDGAKQCIQSPLSRVYWHTKSRPRMLAASKATFLENYLAVSGWILNGYSIECREKKKQPFRLSGVPFGSQAILISGENWLDAGAVCTSRSDNSVQFVFAFVFVFVCVCFIVCYLVRKKIIPWSISYDLPYIPRIINRLCKSNDWHCEGKVRGDDKP